MDGMIAKKKNLRWLALGGAAFVVASGLALTSSIGASNGTADDAPALAAAVTPAASAEPAALAADDETTREEYEQAVQNYLDCGEQGGLIPDPVPGSGLRPTQPGFRAPDADGQPDRESTSAAHQVRMECFALHFRDVDVQWQLQQGSGDDAATAAALEHLTECLHEVEAPNTPETVTLDFLNSQFSIRERTQEDWQWQRAYRGCADRVEVETGYRFP